MVRAAAPRYCLSDLLATPGTKPMASLLTRFTRDEDGATAVEYAVMMSIIVLFMVGALSLFGTKIAGTFNTLSTTLK